MESRISALLQEIVLSNPARTFLFIRWALEVVRPLHLDAPLAEMGPFLRGGIKWCGGGGYCGSETEREECPH